MPAICSTFGDVIPFVKVVVWLRVVDLDDHRDIHVANRTNADHAGGQRKQTINGVLIPAISKVAL